MNIVNNSVEEVPPVEESSGLFQIYDKAIPLN